MRKVIGIVAAVVVLVLVGGLLVMPSVPREAVAGYNTITGDSFAGVTSTTFTVYGTSGSSTVLLPANAQRGYAAVVMTTAAGTAYVSLSGTATVGLGLPLFSQGSSYELNRNNMYRGAVTANVASGQSATLVVTEGQ